MSRIQRIIIYTLICCGSAAFTVYYLWHLRSGYTKAKVSGKSNYVAIGAVSFLFDKTEDFEKSDAQELSDKLASSGKNSQHFSPKLEYGYSLNLKMQDFLSYGVVRKIEVSAKFYGDKIPADAKIVCSVNNKDKTLYWQGLPIKPDSVTFKPNTWTEINASFDIITDTLDPQDELKIYIWNSGKNDFYIDDMNFSFFGINPNHQTFTEKQASEQKLNWIIDLETGDGLENNQTISTEKARSGKQSVKLAAGAEYGAGIKKQISSITYDTLKTVYFSAYVYPTEDKNNVVFVCNVIDAAGKSKIWLGKGTENQPLKKNEWNLVNAEFKVAECSPQPGDNVVVYPWNKGSQTVYVDDYTIVFNTAKRIGNVPNIDMREKSAENYPTENKPPYQTIDVAKKEVAGFDLNKPENSNLNTNATLLSGNFTGGQLDNLAIINNKNCEIFGYCPSENSFKRIIKVEDECFDKNQNTLLAYKRNNFPASIISINKSGKMFLLTFPSSGANACNTKALMDKKELHFENSVGVDKQKYFCIQSSTGDGFLLGINEIANTAAVYKIENDIVKNVWSGNLNQVADGKSVQIFNMILNGKNELIVVSQKPEGLIAKAISFDGKNFSTLINTTLFKNKVEEGDAFYFFSEAANNGTNILKLNTGNRFNAELMYVQNERVSTSCKINFASAQNPKYYEAVKFIAGNFLNPNEWSCIVISCNCSDNDFKGGDCKKFDTINELPNSVQVFELK